MGLATNYPFALAAGLGLNAVVAYQLILGKGMPWEQAMAIIVWEGILITIFVLTGLREQLMDAIPMSLKRAIAVGIGLFILLIGLVDGGFVVGGGGTPLGLGALNTPAILVFLVGPLRGPRAHGTQGPRRAPHQHRRRDDLRDRPAGGLPGDVGLASRRRRAGARPLASPT